MNPYTQFGFLNGFLLGIYFLNIPPALGQLKELYGTSYTDSVWWPCSGLRPWAAESTCSAPEVGRMGDGTDADL